MTKNVYYVSPDTPLLEAYRAMGEHQFRHLLVLVDGVRTRTLGRVSMDMLAIDLEPVPQAAPGSQVTLWGRARGGTVLPIDEVAQAAGTIGYELMCALAPRVPVGVDPA